MYDFFLAEKLEAKRPPKRSRRRWKVSTKSGLKGNNVRV
jgi:hypothetical protein